MQDGKEGFNYRRPDVAVEAWQLEFCIQGVRCSASDSRPTPAGLEVPVRTVQFTFDGKEFGNPVKLDAKGQSVLKPPRTGLEKHKIGARYTPAKGSPFLPSSSIELARELVKVGS